MTPRTAQMTLTSSGIRIGIATIPRQSSEVSDDAAMVQRALLAKPGRTSREVAQSAVMWACSFAAAFVGALLIVEKLP